MRRTVSTVLAALLALVCATASLGAAPLAPGAQPAETAHGAGLDDLHRLAVVSARSKLQLRRDRDRVDGRPAISPPPSSEGGRAWPPEWTKARARWPAAAHSRLAAGALPPAAALRRPEWMVGPGAGGREIGACRTARGPPPNASV